MTIETAGTAIVSQNVTIAGKIEEAEGKDKIDRKIKEITWKFLDEVWNVSRRGWDANIIYEVTNLTW